MVFGTSRTLFIGRNYNRFRKRSKVANNVDPRADRDQLMIQRLKQILDRDDRSWRVIRSCWVAVVESETRTLSVV